MIIDISDNEEKLVIERYTQLKQERTKFVSRWKDIQKYVSISNEINSEFDDTRQGNEQKDVFINDPTVFNCVNQAGDYLAGILWNGNAVTLEPSKYIKDLGDSDEISKFYKKATDIFLEQMNSTDSGFQAVLRPCCYDQFSFGTSGIGVFLSKEFENSQSESCLSFKPYGVWNCAIDEGNNNRIDVVYCVYNWRLNQVIEEFCYEGDELSKELFDKMPEEIKKAYDANKFNKKFKLVFGILPNNSFSMGLRGKRGAKYKGYWFLENGKKIFKTEYFKKMPIAMGRSIKVNNQVYGECSGSLAISSIKMLNHIMGKSVDNIEKTTDPALGMISGALANGNVFNRSAGAVNIFNPQAMANNQNPIFPVGTVGDISAVVNFLIPELRKNLVNIFKIDQLLDFNNQTQMTATESSYRMSIRGKSINGLLSQAKTEIIEPVCHRAISIIAQCGLFGKNLDDLPEASEEDVIYKQKVIKDGDFIPPVIVDAIKENKIWYKLKFNGELEKFINAEIYEAIGRFLQYISAVIQIKPEIVHAINAYEFLELLKSVSNLVNDNLIKTKTEYNDLINAMQQAAQEQAQQQAMMQQIEALKNVASAQKDGMQAQGTQEGMGING